MKEMLKNVEEFQTYVEGNEELQQKIADAVEGLDEEAAAAKVIEIANEEGYEIKDLSEELPQELNDEDMSQVSGGASYWDQFQHTWRKVQRTIGNIIKHLPKPRCFAGDAKISTPNGTKMIKDIKVGDEVFGVNEQDQKVTTKVVSVNPVFQEKIFEVEFSDGTKWNATKTQWFYCGKDDYASIVDTQGKSALTEGGQKVEVVKVTDTGKVADVYDFTVEGVNVFFVNGVAAEGYGED